jgi:hypothetical protein
VLFGSLPRGAAFIDLDAWCEIDNRFLFIEHKPEGYSWDQRSEGQRLALKRLARVPRCTVWWIRDKPPGFEVWDFLAGPLGYHTLEELRDRIAWWADDGSG